MYSKQSQGNFEAVAAEAHQPEEAADTDRQPPGGGRQCQGGARRHGHSVARQGEEGKPRVKEGTIGFCHVSGNIFWTT